MKMKPWFSLALSAAFLLVTTLTFGQSITGEGDVVEETRKVSGFTKIKVRQGIDLFLKTGSSDKVVVKTHQNVQDVLRTEVKGEVLEIYLEKGVRRVQKMDVYVTAAQLKEIHASSGSDVEGMETIEAQDLTIHASSGSDVDLELNAKSLHLEVSGGADANLEGEVASLKGKASGGADINAKKLKAESVWLRTSGGSDASVYATGEIDMEASGGSDINYRGGAKVVHMKASGSSDINGQ